jgi:hypothetical protein
MTSQVNPVTLEKVRAFGRRRWRLALLRNVSVLVLVGLGALGAIALADRLAVLPDFVRRVFCVGGYLATATALVRLIRDTLRPASLRELARRMEAAAPELRGELLSAVELGDSDARWDSEVFRSLVQSRVAERVRQVDVGALLPFRRILPRAGSAALAVAIGLLLWAFPSLRAGELARRALLPWANLDRVSTLRVELLEPRPLEGIVPEGDTVPIVVATSEAPGGEPLVEVFRDGAWFPERTVMRPTGQRRFEAGLAMGPIPLSYRVRAGDAVTRTYALRPQPRPVVTAFRKVYRLPAYVQRPPRTLREESGDLSELEGTEVELTLEVTQDIERGELVLTREGQTSSVQLEKTTPRLLRARIPIAPPGTYAVRLVAAGTGLENKAGKRYRIRSQVDAWPRVELVKPDRDLRVSPDGIVDIQGKVKDDIGVARLSQAVRVNVGGWKPWKETLIRENLGERAELSHVLDLVDYDVSAGNQVELKWIAVDLKGNVAETVPVRIDVHSLRFPSGRWEAIRDKGRAHAALAEERQSILQLEGPADPKLDLKKIVEKFDRAEQLFRQVVRWARKGREDDDVVLLSLLADRAGRLVRQALAAPSPERSTLLKRARELVSLGVDLYGPLSASDEALLLLREAKDFDAELKLRLADPPKAEDPRSCKRWLRQVGAVAAETDVLVGALDGLRGRLPEAVGRRVGEAASALRTRTTELRGAASKRPAPELVPFAAELRKQIGSFVAELSSSEPELAKAADAARQALSEKVPPSAADIQELIESVKAIVEAEPSRRDELAQAAIAQGRGLIRLLEGRRRTEYHRVDARQKDRVLDEDFLRDLSLTNRVLDAFLGDLAKAPLAARRVAKSLEGVALAFRRLENAHRWESLVIALRELAEDEKPEAEGDAAAMLSPRDWKWVEDRMKRVPQEFREAKIPTGISNHLSSIWGKPEVARVAEVMAARGASRQLSAGVPRELDAVYADALAVKPALKTSLETARGALEKMLPPPPPPSEETARRASQGERPPPPRPQNFGQLPPALRRELSEKGAENVAPEYQAEVEAYLKALEGTKK